MTGKQAEGTGKPSNFIGGQDTIKNLPVAHLWKGVCEREEPFLTTSIPVNLCGLKLIYMEHCKQHNLN